MFHLLNFVPPSVMPSRILCKQNTPRFSQKQTLRLMSWNIQYGAGRKYRFFYDGGNDVVVALQDIKETLKKIISIVRKYDPDVILWQEIDTHSKRSRFVNEMDVLWNALSYRCRSDATYHRSRFVPTPSLTNAMGAVDMRLAVFSKYKLENGVRYALPMLKEHPIRQAFNLKRAVHKIDLPFEEGGKLSLHNTHFSAFSCGDGTLQRQTQKLIDILSESATNPWLLAGDLNMLSPDADRSKIPDAERIYPHQNNPMKTLFQKYHSTLSLEQYKQNPAIYNTYLPQGQNEADRWLDYIFHSTNVETQNHSVLRECSEASDHLPILVELKVS